MDVHYVAFSTYLHNPVYYKTKVILPAISISVQPLPQHYTALNKSLLIQIFYLMFCFITQTWSNNTLLDSLGNPKKAVQLNITTGIFKGVSPLISFVYLISFTNWSKQPKFCKGFPHVAPPPPSAQFTPESESYFTRAEKN